MSLAIVTPSCAPDFTRFRRLHNSVLRHTGADVMHYTIVPPPDFEMFSSLASSRLTVLREPEVLPHTFLSAARLSRILHLPRGYRVAAVNLRHPWPPVRGWILQQILKLAFVSTLEADVALMIDSDVLLARELSEGAFIKDGSVRHYRLPQGLNPDMERHLRWRATAQRLLNVAAPSPDYADYIAGLVSWSPDVVRKMLGRVESELSRPWQTVVAAQLEFSEFILYGEYIAALGTPAEQAFESDQTLCHSRWDPSPLSMSAAEDFLATMPATDIAIHIQSNSETTEDVLAYIANAVGA